MAFLDRRDAGARLASALEHLRGEDLVVLGLPRGGVPVAFEVAAALEAPLDVILVRKLGLPFQREVAMGAIGEGGVRVVDQELCRSARVGPAEVDEVEAEEQRELARRSTLIRSRVPRLDLEGRTAVVVDDGMATGSTARAASEVARAHGATRVVLAVPVALRDADRRLEGAVDELVVLSRPTMSRAVGQHYEDFGQVPDEDVLDLLERARGRGPGPTSADDAGLDDPRGPRGRRRSGTV